MTATTIRSRLTLTTLEARDNASASMVLSHTFGNVWTNHAPAMVAPAQPGIVQDADKLHRVMHRTADSVPTNALVTMAHPADIHNAIPLNLSGHGHDMIKLHR